MSEPKQIKLDKDMLKLAKLLKDYREGGKIE
jgi:hypothetical protein